MVNKTPDKYKKPQSYAEAMNLIETKRQTLKANSEASGASVSKPESSAKIEPTDEANTPYTINDQTYYLTPQEFETIHTNTLEGNRLKKFYSEISNQKATTELREQVLSRELNKTAPTNIPTIQQIAQRVKYRPVESGGLGAEGEIGFEGEFGELGKFTASWLDTAKSLISRKEPLSITNTRQNLQQIKTALNKDIQDVSVGVIPASVVYNELEDAVGALIRLQSAAYENGADVNYLIDKGISMESELVIERQNLERMRRDLIIAAETARANQAAMRLGLSP